MGGSHNGGARSPRQGPGRLVFARCPRTPALSLTSGREAFDRQAWGEAYKLLTAADRAAPLGPPDLERLGLVTHLLGKSAESLEVLGRTHQAYLAAGNPIRAARAAFWLGFELVNRGDVAQGGGWLARARRLIDEARTECAEQGYLLLPDAIRATREDPATALGLFQRVHQIGTRFHEPDLTTFALLGQGRALLRQGETRRGMALLDEAMVGVVAGEVTPPVVGAMFCSLLDACHEVFDMRRAHEWTTALTAWCAAQPEVVLYRGQCAVRRAELMRLHGEWQDALAETVRAREWLSDPPGQQGLVAAVYHEAEIQRLQGRFADAEALYRQVSALGRTPHPGLALLRLAQGQLDAAATGISAALDETREPRPRTLMLAAQVEIALANDDTKHARRAADELSRIAAQLDVPYVHALAAQAKGALLLADGKAQAGLGLLRTACGAWTELGAPYEAARVRVLIARAERKAGDPDTADLEIAAARDVFRRLGATADANALEPATPGSDDSGLTGREVEVLRLVASGKTNRAIATALAISEKTVARHVSNIFLKLGIKSRTAAAAYAFQHELTKGRAPTT